MGRTPGEAFRWCYRAERACRMQFAIQRANVDTVALSDEVIKGTVAQSLHELARGLPRDRRRRMAGAAPLTRPDRSEL